MYYIMHKASPLKGSERKNHKWIERSGSPGAYRYVYANNKSVKRSSESGENQNGSDQRTFTRNTAYETNSKALKSKIPNFKNLNIAGSNATYDEKVNQIWAACTESNDNGQVSFFDSSDARFHNGNCYAVTTAYLARRMGYDVQSQVDVGAMYGIGEGATEDEIELVFKDSHFTRTAKSTVAFYTDSSAQQKVLNDLRSQGDGARGYICGYYAPALGGGGHAMAYEIVDGKVLVIDGQEGKVYEEDQIFTDGCMLMYFDEAMYMPVCDAGGKNEKQFNTDPVQSPTLQENGTPHIYPKGIVNAMLEPADRGKYHENADGGQGESTPKTDTQTPKPKPKPKPAVLPPSETDTDRKLLENIYKEHPSDEAKKMLKTQRRFFVSDSLLGLGADAVLSKSETAKKRMAEYDMKNNPMYYIGSTTGSKDWNNDSYISKYLHDRGVRYYDPNRDVYYNNHGDEVTGPEMLEMINLAKKHKKEEGY